MRTVCFYWAMENKVDQGLPSSLEGFSAGHVRRDLLDGSQMDSLKRFTVFVVYPEGALLRWFKLYGSTHNPRNCFLSVLSLILLILFIFCRLLLALSAVCLVCIYVLEMFTTDPGLSQLTHWEQSSLPWTWSISLLALLHPLITSELQLCNESNPHGQEQTAMLKSSS